MSLELFGCVDLIEDTEEESSDSLGVFEEHKVRLEGEESE